MDQSEIHKIDHHLGHIQNILKRVLGGISTHSPRRAENENGWVGRKNIEITERSQIGHACFVNRAGKSNGPRRNSSQQLAVQVSSFQCCGIKRTESTHLETRWFSTDSMEAITFSFNAALNLRRFSAMPGSEVATI